MSNISTTEFSDDIEPRRPMALDQEQADDYVALNNPAYEIEIRVTEAVHWYLRKRSG